MKRVFSISAAALLLTGAVSVLNAQDTLSELQELKAAHRALLKRIEALEAKLEAEQGAKPRPVAAAADNEEPEPLEAIQNKGVLELTSANTVLGVGGQIQLDTHYGWPEGSHTAGGVPLDKSGANGQLNMSARDSRFWVKTRTPSRYGMIRSLIETDFWGNTENGNEISTNSYGLRLRHAYIQVGSWTAGQTNSVFNADVTMDTLYDAIDYTLVRQPLIRYSVENGRWAYDVSLEQPETTLTDPDGVIITPEDDRLPDVGMRLRYYPQWGEAGIAAMMRRIRQDRALLGDGTQLTRSDEATGWGVNGYGSYRFGNNDDIRAGASYGKGIGRYVAYSAFGAGSVDATGRITLQEVYGLHMGYRHWWHDALRSTLAFSYAGSNRTGSATNVTESSRSVQANLLWTPASRMLVGVEYARALRELESGEDGEMELLRMTLRYNF